MHISRRRFFSLCVLCLSAEMVAAQEYPNGIPFTVTYTFDTEGTTACGTNENPAQDENPAPGETVAYASDFRRVGITCVDDVDDAFGGSGFGNAFDNGKNFIFTISSTFFQDIKSDESDALSFIVSRTDDGPSELRAVMRVWYYATLRIETILDTVSLSTAPTPYLFNLPDTIGARFDFEFQARYSSGMTPDPQGAIYFDEVAVTGTELPVELTSFSALAQGNTALLRWTTASETNNAGFDVQIQRGEVWHTLGFVLGAGTTAEVQHYQYRTTDLAPATYRFRLRQVDFDGATGFSEEVEVTIAAAGLALSAPRPNPASRAVAVLASDRTRDVRVLIYDALGRRVAVAFDGALEANTSREVVLDAEAWGLPAGVYMMRAESDAEAQTRTFVVR